MTSRGQATLAARSGEVRLVPGPVAAPLPTPDASQSEAIRLAVAGESFTVVGAPGSGRTTTALALVVDAVSRGVPPDEVLLLSPRRRSAGELRNRLAALIDVPTSQPLVRTPASLAFAILRREALIGPAPRPAPVLISGPDQDAILAELLAGHLEGAGVRLDLPEGLPLEALGQRAFRAELRDLLMRAAERGVDPVGLDALGRVHSRQEWVLAAQLFEEYRDVTGPLSQTPDVGERLDPAVLVERAAEVLRDWPQARGDAPRWRLVVVDDLQEATQAVADLLGVLRRDGAQVVLLGDPDIAVQTHRGAVPRLVADGIGIEGSGRVVLERSWRQSGPLREVTRRFTAQIRPSGVATHRQAPGAPAVPDAADAEGRPPSEVDGGLGAPEPDAPSGPAPVQVALLSSGAQQSAYIAHVLREAALVRGVPWSQMAVLVRGGAQVAALRSGLARLDVPVTVPTAEVPVRDEPAVRPLLLALECALAPVLTDALTEDAAHVLLTSPIGGLDSLGMRRLRRALRAAELAGGGYRASGALLIEVLGDEIATAALPSLVRGGALRVARVLGAGRRAADDVRANAQTVLWALWESSGLSEQWQRAALAGGPAGVRADRDLDAVVALFKAAERFTERHPQAPASAFASHLREQELAEDTLAARGAEGRAVTVCTAASAAGLEWDLVVVAGVQEGSWPDLRLRDSLLGSQGLVDVLAGRVVGDAGHGASVPTDGLEARRSVLDDELRSFTMALSRARSRLVVTAVQSAEDRPSSFVDLVEAPPQDTDAVDPRVVAIPVPLDLRGLVADLRASVLAGDDGGAGVARAAAATLARLASHGVAGADPREWFGLAEPSTTASLHEASDVVTVSPSKVEQIGTCPLRWALESAGGRRAGTSAASIGSLVHEIAAQLPVGTADEMLAELDRRWDSLGLGDGWVAAVDRQRVERMIDHLASYVRAHPAVLGVELEVDVEIGSVRLRGRADRVETTSAGLRIVDFKTGSASVSLAEGESNPQLGVYQAAVEAGAFGEHRSDGASLVLLAHGAKSATERSQVPLCDAVDPQWASELLGRVRGRMSGAVMLAVDNAGCTYCPVRRSCPVRDEGGQVTA